MCALRARIREGCEAGDAFDAPWRESWRQGHHGPVQLVKPAETIAESTSVMLGTLWDSGAVGVFGCVASSVRMRGVHKSGCQVGCRKGSTERTYEPLETKTSH